MNFEYFIARKVATSKGEHSFSRLIIRIAIIAIALSLTVMIVTTSVVSGFKNQIREKIFGFWGHIHITDASSAHSLVEVFPLSINQDFYPDLENIGQVSYTDNFRLFGQEFENIQVEKTTKGGVNHIQVFGLKPGIIKTKKEIEGIILKGVGEDFNWDFFEGYLKEGSLLDFQDSTFNGIIISRQTADRLELGLGDNFEFHYVENGDPLVRRFKIKGIYKTGLEEYDKQFAIVDIRKIQQIYKWEPDEVGGFEVFIDDLEDLEVLTDYIYIQELPGRLYCENIRQKRSPIFEWLALQDINEIVILTLMLIVGIINMITALMILILERTNMIGILKAVGHTNLGIRKIFLYHAGYIILIGLLLGNFLGISLCMLQSQFGFMTLSEENYYLSVVPIELNLWTILALNLGTLIITILFLIIPSYLVARISPVKAIRFR